MQIDADPQEDQQNAPDTNYIVENPTLVLILQYYLIQNNYSIFDDAMQYNCLFNHNIFCLGYEHD